MIGKILAHLLGNASQDFEAGQDEDYKELMESEDGGWVIVNLPGKSLEAISAALAVTTKHGNLLT